MSDTIAKKVAPDENLAQETAPSRAFTVLEASLPAELGVSRDLVREIRKLQLAEGSDWVKRHKDIWLTTEGVEKIARALALITATKFTNTEADRPSALAPEAEAGEPPEGPGRDGDKPLMRNREALGLPSPTGNAGANNFQAPKVERFKVMRSNFRNTRVVSAYDPADPKRLVWVTVRDSAKWMAGMEIEGVHEHHDQYRLHGPEPRWRGKR